MKKLCSIRFERPKTFHLLQLLSFSLGACAFQERLAAGVRCSSQDAPQSDRLDDAFLSDGNDFCAQFPPNRVSFVRKTLPEKGAWL